MALQPFVGPWPHFQFLNLYAVSRTPWTGDRTVARLLPAHGTTQIQNKRTQTSIPRMGFESTTPVLEREKTVHVLDRTANVIGTRIDLSDATRIISAGPNMVKLVRDGRQMWLAHQHRNK
jgi:DNA-binding transcriptional regulator of glucitol operon